ncbi:DUF4136 domain-containing protein [Variovorax sp. HJSM1_2]|uniref:DUF4136 domain-containing protein n=1 Tax=Variovorax sp. HJSM1_2 TaxID=3366263 RepID=UPI003BC5B8E8
MLLAFNARVLAPVALAASLLLSGCASGPSARADYDRSVDFSTFKTFTFAKPLGTDKNGYQSIVSQNLMAATQRELEARGLRLAASDAQLLVNFNGRLTQKLQVDTVPVGWGMQGGYYGYRTGMYGGWARYNDQTIATPYTEGTLNIDVVDAAAKKMVWEGVVTDTVTEADLNNVQVPINAAVAAAFKKFPIQPPAPKPAGTAAPTGGGGY